MDDLSKPMAVTDPMVRVARSRHEFGEHRGVNLSIETSATFTVIEAGKIPALFEGREGPKGGCFLYGRHFNPTVMVLARHLAALEGTPHAYCTASGMAAISGALLHACNTGDHVVTGQALYGGTWALLHDFLLRKANISTTFVNLSDLDKVQSAFKKILECSIAKRYRIPPCVSQICLLSRQSLMSTARN